MIKTRRQFFKSMAGASAIAAMPQGGMAFWSQSSAVHSFSDYKALVCVFLYGGNDSWNTVAPYSNAEYNAYAAARGGENTWGLAIPRDKLLPIRSGGTWSDGKSFGFHPSVSGLHTLYESGAMALMPNVGPLIRPTTLDDYRQARLMNHPLPPQLFSHNDQQRQWETLRGNQLINTGWAGRIADTLVDALTDQKLPANISLTGQTPFQAGELDGAYAMSPSGIVEIDGLFSGPLHIERRREISSIYRETLRSDRRSIYERAYSRTRQRLMDYAEIVNEVFDKAPDFPLLPNNLPSNNEQLRIQLRTVAKMIAMRDMLGSARQVFLVSAYNFDSHGKQMEDQPKVLADLSRAFKSFFDTINQLGISHQVTLFTQSDFGRTLTSNGDGSDHGWGGLQMVLGGAVRGGRMYGDYPQLTVGSDLDVGGGVFIPTIAADQYAATLARWFGVSEDLLDYVAPHLRNFPVRDLGFMS